MAEQEQPIVSTERKKSDWRGLGNWVYGIACGVGITFACQLGYHHLTAPKAEDKLQDPKVLAEETIERRLESRSHWNLEERNVTALVGSSYCNGRYFVVFLEEYVARHPGFKFARKGYGRTNELDCAGAKTLSDLAEKHGVPLVMTGIWNNDSDTEFILSSLGPDLKGKYIPGMNTIYFEGAK